MFARFSRSWRLVKASASVLAQDKELLVFPLLSAICAVIITASFVLPMLGLGLLDGTHDRSNGFSIVLYLPVFLFYLVQYTIIFFFNSALVGAAMIRLEGGNPSVRDGLRIATSRLRTILGYALIAATLGVLLRTLQERAGWLGRWIGGLLGVAWTVASFLVIPVLVSRQIGPLNAVKESALLLKKTWGENLIGQGGIGLAFGLFYTLLLLMGAAALVATVLYGNGILIGMVITLFLISLLVTALIQSALSGIYSAALYRHAMGQGETTGFEPALLQHAFTHKA